MSDNDSDASSFDGSYQAGPRGGCALWNPLSDEELSALGVLHLDDLLKRWETTGTITLDAILKSVSAEVPYIIASEPPTKNAKSKTVSKAEENAFNAKFVEIAQPPTDIRVFPASAVLEKLVPLLNIEYPLWNDDARTVKAEKAWKLLEMLKKRMDLGPVWKWSQEPAFSSHLRDWLRQRVMPVLWYAIGEPYPSDTSANTFFTITDVETHHAPTHRPEIATTSHLQLFVDETFVASAEVKGPNHFEALRKAFADEKLPWSRAGEEPGIKFKLLQQVITHAVGYGVPLHPIITPQGWTFIAYDEKLPEFVFTLDKFIPRGKLLDAHAFFAAGYFGVEQNFDRYLRPVIRPIAASRPVVEEADTSMETVATDVSMEREGYVAGEGDSSVESMNLDFAFAREVRRGKRFIGAENLDLVLRNLLVCMFSKMYKTTTSAGRIWSELLEFTVVSMLYVFACWGIERPTQSTVKPTNIWCQFGDNFFQCDILTSSDILARPPYCLMFSERIEPGISYRTADQRYVAKFAMDPRQHKIHKQLAGSIHTPGFFGTLTLRGFTIGIMENLGDEMLLELEALRGEDRRQMLLALQDIHYRGYHHHDVAPRNYRRRADGTIALFDFEFAKPADTCTSCREILFIKKAKGCGR